MSSQRGAINILLIPFILVTLFFFGAAGMGIHAFGQRQHYQNNIDEITQAFVEVSNKALNEQKDKEFAEKAKYPFNTYTSSASTGTAILKYPKNWAAYVEEQNQGSLPVNAYFYPNFVPNVQENKTNFALRMRIIQQTYDSVLQQYTPQIQRGTVKLRPYKPDNVPGVIGSRLDGAVQTQKQGTMVIMPVRDKTVQIWTEAQVYNADYFNIILPNFTMSP